MSTFDVWNATDVFAPVDAICDTIFPVETHLLVDTATAPERPSERAVYLVREGQFLPAARIIFQLAVTDHVAHREALRQLDDRERSELARFYSPYLAQEYGFMHPVPAVLHNWSLCCEVNPWEEVAR